MSETKSKRAKDSAQMPKLSPDLLSVYEPRENVLAGCDGNGFREFCLKRHSVGPFPTACIVT